MLHETTETSLRALCEEPNIMYQQISSTLQSGGGGGGEEVRWKTVRTYGKILATPLTVMSCFGLLKIDVAVA